jgi:glucokinase
MNAEPWAIGIDIGGTKSIITKITVEGTVATEKKIPTRVQDGSMEILQDIIKEIQNLESASPNKPEAIGIGIAGQILPQTGLVKFAPNLNWHNFPLQELIEKAFAIPTLVLNDVRAATWAEWQYGAGSGSDNVVYLMIGTGIGGGIVLDGHLIAGANNSAGELGHFPIQLHGGPQCSCGNSGCLEAIASGWAIAKYAKEAILTDPKQGAALLTFINNDLLSLTAREVLECAKEGDSLSLQIINQAIHAITTACVGFVNVFNPSCLILGGGLGNALPKLAQLVEVGIRRNALETASSVLQVKLGQLSENAVAIGAATYALEKLHCKHPN